MKDKKYIVTKMNGQALSCLVAQNRLLLADIAPMDGREGSTGLVGAIYIGKVKNIIPNIRAAFVEIAPKKLCYLPLDECRSPYLTNRAYDGRILLEDEIVVQIAKEAGGGKEAVATARLTFTGKYAVILAEGSAIFYSSRLTDEVKDRIRTFLSIHLPNPGHRIIIRTNAGELEDDTVLLQEIQALCNRCEAIFRIAKTRTCYSVLEQTLPVYLARLRDLHADEYDEIVTDDALLYEKIKSCLLAFAQDSMPKLRFYEDADFPLLKLYGLETKLKEALAKRVWLKSGGYLIIEPTQALTVIDVNSGKNVQKKEKETAFFLINKEAAKEIAIQLRLRNLSGIILIDFINMQEVAHQKELLSFFSSLLKNDTVKTQVIDMTPLGLVEVTRKKISKTLEEQLLA